MMAIIQRKWEDVRYALKKGQASLDELAESLAEVARVREKDLVILQTHREDLEALSGHVGHFCRADEEKQT